MRDRHVKWNHWVETAYTIRWSSSIGMVGYCLVVHIQVGSGKEGEGNMKREDQAVKKIAIT